MVTLSCDKCGDSLKKQHVVDKHRTQCSDFNGVYHCIDCNRAFEGEEYRAHVKCVSEAQRYGGANYVAVQPKGEAKQDAFMEKTKLNEAINEELAANGGGGKHRALYERLQQYSNVPRKEAKFRNFAEASLNCRSEAALSDLWKLVERAQQRQKEERMNEEKTTKVSAGADGGSEAVGEENDEQKVKMHKVIKRLLAENEGGVPLEELRKQLHKVTKRSLSEIEEELSAKIAKAKAVEVNGVVKRLEQACTHCPLHCFW